MCVCVCVCGGGEVWCVGGGRRKEFQSAAKRTTDFLEHEMSGMLLVLPYYIYLASNSLDFCLLVIQL